MYIVRRWLVLALSLLGMSPLVLADEAADRAALEAAAQTWVKAFNADNDAALVALATEDVVLLDPNAPAVSGREAARRVWQRALSTTKGQVTSATKEAVITGDSAWRIVAFTQTLANGEVVSGGQSLEIWKRVKGVWQLHRQMTASILSQSPLLPRPLLTEPVLDAPRN